MSTMAETEGRVPCPNCAEQILPAAKTCRFCGAVLGAAAPRQSGGNGSLVAIVVVALLAGLGFCTVADRNGQRAASMRPIGDLLTGVRYDGGTLVVRNASDTFLSGCRMEINDRYAFTGSLRSSGETEFQLINFAASDGTRLNVLQTKPLSVSITCPGYSGSSYRFR